MTDHKPENKECKGYWTSESDKDMNLRSDCTCTQTPVVSSSGWEEDMRKNYMRYRLAGGAGSIGMERIIEDTREIIAQAKAEARADFAKEIERIREKHKDDDHDSRNGYNPCSNAVNALDEVLAQIIGIKDGA